MKINQAWRWSLFVAWVTTASGCAQEDGFSPYGAQWAMDGDWTVASQPPTEEGCGAIDTVRVVFVSERETFAAPELSFSCARGTFQSEAIFRYGTFETRWEALDGAGAVLGQSRSEVLEVASPTRRVMLLGVDFPGE